VLLAGVAALYLSFMTTEQQKAQVQAALDQMAFCDPRIKSAHMDDWDDNGGFNIFIHLNMVNVQNMRAKLRGLIPMLQRIARVHNLRWEFHDSPRGQYVKSFHRHYFQGYDRDNYKIGVRV